MPWDVRNSENPRCSFPFPKEMSAAYQELLPTGTRRVIMTAMLELLLSLIKTYGFEQVATALREHRVRLEID